MDFSEMRGNINQNDLAQTFHRLHAERPLVLPNAWDAASAAVIAHAGARAIATTSAGVSWARGRRDGQGLTRAAAVEAIRSIVEAVDVPVSADIEGGYGAGLPEDVMQTVAAVLDAGAVGINLEDTPGYGGAPILSAEEQALRIRAARTAADDRGLRLFINARTDVYLAQIGRADERLEDVLRRAAVYIDAGADGIFVPAVRDPETIAALVTGIDAPLNVMVGPGALRVEELSQLRVARLSFGSAVATAALGLVHRAAMEALVSGTYKELDQGWSFGNVESLFDH